METELGLNQKTVIDVSIGNRHEHQENKYLCYEESTGRCFLPASMLEDLRPTPLLNKKIPVADAAFELESL